MNTDENNFVARLVACGITETNALSLYENYKNRSDLQGLERYVRLVELIFDDRNEYPKEDY